MKDIWYKLKNTIWKEYIVGIKGQKLWIIILKTMFFIEVAALIADFSKQPYLRGWEWLEELVNYDIALVVPVVAIAWGAVSIPMGFLLGQIERRNYGIRLVNLLIAAWGLRDAVLLIISFCIQLGFIILSVSYEMLILFTAVVWVQLIYVLFAFYIVMLSLSREAILSIIKNQCEKVCEDSQKESIKIEDELKNKSVEEKVKFLTTDCVSVEQHRFLLKEMIKHIDFHMMEDVEVLESIFCENVCKQVRGIYGRKVVYDFMQILLLIAKQDTVEKITNDIFEKEIGIDAQKGILEALISERHTQYYKHCILLLKEYGDIELFCCGILWGIHQKLFIEDAREKLENEYFVEQLQCLIKATDKKSELCNEEYFNNIVWESCKDIMFLKKVKDLDRIISGIFEFKLG